MKKEIINILDRCFDSIDSDKLAKAKYNALDSIISLNDDVLREEVDAQHKINNSLMVLRKRLEDKNAFLSQLVKSQKAEIEISNKLIIEQKEKIEKLEDRLKPVLNNVESLTEIDPEEHKTEIDYLKYEIERRDGNIKTYQKLVNDKQDEINDQNEIIKNAQEQIRGLQYSIEQMHCIESKLRGDIDHLNGLNLTKDKDTEWLKEEHDRRMENQYQIICGKQKIIELKDAKVTKLDLEISSYLDRLSNQEDEVKSLKESLWTAHDLSKELQSKNQHLQTVVENCELQIVKYQNEIRLNIDAMTLSSNAIDLEIKKTIQRIESFNAKGFWSQVMFILKGGDV